MRLLHVSVLIQLMAAAVAGRDVCYFTYKDNALTRDIHNIHKLMTDKLITVGTHGCFTSNTQSSLHISSPTYLKLDSSTMTIILLSHKLVG